MRFLIYFIALLPLHSFATTGNIDSAKITIIKTELKKLNEQIKIGTSNQNLSKAQFFKIGYGHCDNFSELLKDNLSQQGIPSRKVSIVSSHGGAHTLLEVRVGKKWILTDPLNNAFYKNSLLEIIKNPSLAKGVESIISSPSLSILTTEAFFSGILAVNLGDFYFSDSYRYYSLAQYQSSKGATEFKCNKSACSWVISVPDFLKKDSLLNELSLYKFSPYNRDIKFGFTPLSISEYHRFGWHIPLKDGVIKFETKANGPHAFNISALALATENPNQLNLRTPKPNTFIFRGNPIDFYHASFTCNEKEKWSASPKNDGRFHNSMYIPYNTSDASSWGPLEKDKFNRRYRKSIMNLSGNEPRIRFLPYSFDIKERCHLSIQYRSQLDTQLWIHYELPNQVNKLASIPACKSKVCTFTVSLSEDTLYRLR